MENVIELLQSMITPLTLVGCVVVGYAIKYGTGIPNKYIPTACMVLGIGLNMWACGTISPEVVVAGAVSGLAATGTFEMVRQYLEPNK